MGYNIDRTEFLYFFLFYSLIFLSFVFLYITRSANVQFNLMFYAGLFFRIIPIIYLPEIVPQISPFNHLEVIGVFEDETI